MVAGLQQGSRRSLRLGHDMEFADYKPYTPGDSLRDLDWKVYGRSDRLVVRRYQAETEMSATILFDASADLASTPEKFQQAQLLCATLAWFLHIEREPVGLAVGAGEGALQSWIPPRSGAAHASRILHNLAAVRAAGRADLSRWLLQIGDRLRPRSLLLVVGDFAEEPASWSAALDAMARRRVDLRAFQLYDRREADLDFAQPLRFFSPEGGDRLPLDPVAQRPLFQQEVAHFFEEVDEAVRSRKGHRYLVEARADLVPILSRFIRGAP